MRNLNWILHRLTNRSRDFRDPIYNVASYVPRTTSPEWESLAQYLGLQHRGSDVYVSALLSLLESYPEIRRLFPEYSVSWDTTPRPAWKVVNAELRSIGNTAASVLRGADTFPVGDFIRIRRKAGGTDATLSLIHVVSDAEEKVLHQTETHCFYVDDEIGVRLEWPSWTGISGTISRGYWWSLGQPAEIHHYPVTYPWQVIVDSVPVSPLSQILSAAKLLDAYHTSPTPEERVALMGAALALYG